MYFVDELGYRSSHGHEELQMKENYIQLPQFIGTQKPIADRQVRWLVSTEATNLLVQLVMYWMFPALRVSIRGKSWSKTWSRYNWRNVHVLCISCNLGNRQRRTIFQLQCTFYCVNMSLKDDWLMNTIRSCYYSSSRNYILSSTCKNVS